MALALAALPLGFLILAMTVTWRRVRLPLPAEVALPAAAALALGAHVLTRILHHASTPSTAGQFSRELAARVIEGLLSSLTPLGIVFGAVLLFTTLTTSGAMRTLTSQLQRLAPDPLAQVMLVAWAFSYLIEGLSGFGAPAALAAPILVGLGFPAIRVAAACLVMNSVPVVFGAVGTPIWFGLGELNLPPDDLRTLSLRAVAAQAVVAPLIVGSALALLFPLKRIAARLPHIIFILAATLLGSALVAPHSTEFPSIVGGLAATAAALIAARFTRPPQSTVPEHDQTGGAPTPLSTLQAALPILLTIALLALTRIEPIGLKALLTAKEPAATLSLGPLGELAASPAAVVSLQNILRTDLAWSMPVLYIPFIIPFVVIALLCIPLLRMPAAAVRDAWSSTFSRLAKPAIALAGALVLVKLMMHAGESAPVLVIGNALAKAVGAVDPNLWPAAAPALGALGSFFSGSATVSNLTFAPVQFAIADDLGLDHRTVLAMQALGGALGNMICIHNIVAVAAVLGLLGTKDETAQSPVAAILRLTIAPAALALAAVAAFALLL